MPFKKLYVNNWLYIRNPIYWTLGYEEIRIRIKATKNQIYPWKNKKLELDLSQSEKKIQIMSWKYVFPVCKKSLDCK